MDHYHHVHENHKIPTTDEKVKLATSATVHCLLGCGLGEIFGVIIGKALPYPMFIRLSWLSS